MFFDLVLLFFCGFKWGFQAEQPKPKPFQWGFPRKEWHSHLLADQSGGTFGAPSPTPLKMEQGGAGRRGGGGVGVRTRGGGTFPVLGVEMPLAPW